MDWVDYVQKACYWFQPAVTYLSSTMRAILIKRGRQCHLPVLPQV